MLSVDFGGCKFVLFALRRLLASVVLLGWGCGLLVVDLLG